MRKIRRFVRGKKQFDFSINCDGISVSLQYSAKKKKNKKEMDRSRIVEMIMDGTIKNFAGTDTGSRSWNTTVTHNIKTGKEVSFVFIHVVCVSMENTLCKCQNSITIYFFQFIFFR